MSTVAPFVAVSTTVRPNRRPPRPKHPKFTQFHRSGLHFGRIHPQHRQYGDSSKAYGDCQSVRGRRQGLAGHRKRRTDPHHSPQPHRCGGRRRDRRARAAGPEGARNISGTTSNTAHQAPPVWRAPEGTEGQAAVPSGRRQGLAGQRADAPGHAQRYSAAGVEGAGGSGGPGRASRRGAERSEALASRAAGPSGARNTRGATSNPTQQAGGPPPTGTGTPSSPTQRAPGSAYDSETSPATTSPRGSRRARPR